MHPLLKEISEKIKNRRLELGLTQEQVAKYAGISQRNYQRIENSQSSPNINSLIIICDALKMELSELFVNSKEYNQE